MKRTVFAALAWGAFLMVLVVSILSLQLLAQDKASQTPPALKVGDMAPDFTLKYFDGTDVKDVSLKDFKGKKNVVLAFYVFAFTPG